MFPNVKSVELLTAVRVGFEESSESSVFHSVSKCKHVSPLNCVGH